LKSFCSCHKSVLVVDVVDVVAADDEDVVVDVVVVRPLVAGAVVLHSEVQSDLVRDDGPRCRGPPLPMNDKKKVEKYANSAVLMHTKGKAGCSLGTLIFRAQKR